MNLSRLVAYNTLIQIVSKSISVVFGITTTAILTNYLGASGFGDYIFALSIVSIFSSISDWGITLIAVREASRNKINQGQIFGNVILLRLALSTAAMIIVWVLAFIFPFNSSHPLVLRHLILLASLLIVIFALKTSLEIIFQAKLKLDRMALTELIASLLTLVFVVFVVIISNTKIIATGIVAIHATVIILIPFIFSP